MGLIHVYGKSEIRCVCLAPNVSEDASEVVDIKSGGQWCPVAEHSPRGGRGCSWLVGDGGWRLYNRARNLLRQHE